MQARSTFTETSSNPELGEMLKVLDRLGANDPIPSDFETWPGNAAVHRRIVALAKAVRQTLSEAA